ncbi:MAG: DnaJ domain-containing protein [Alphaproteobacteria bacterium]|nr:DnaJ domain-containing protein [Alphaproteobacteria bacterium]
MQTPEQVLGVQQGATQEEIRQAYKRWMKFRSPVRETDPDQRWAKRQALKNVDRAYMTLIHGPERRKRARAHN